MAVLVLGQMISASRSFSTEELSNIVCCSLLCLVIDLSHGIARRVDPTNFVQASFWVTYDMERLKRGASANVGATPIVERVYFINL